MHESESESHSVMSDSLQPVDYTVWGILQARIIEWVAPFPSPGDLPNPLSKPGSSTLQVGSLPAKPPGKQQAYRSSILAIPLGLVNHSSSSLDSEFLQSGHLVPFVSVGQHPDSAYMVKKYLFHEGSKTLASESSLKRT